MAAARIVLLVLSVGLFAAAWSGDVPQSRPVARSVSAPMQDTTSQLVSLSRVIAPEIQEPRGCDPSASLMALLEEWQLPLGVTPGDYLLAETTGETQRVELTAELLQSLGHDPDVRGEPFYTLTAAARSAYLIRLTASRDGNDFAAQASKIEKR